MAKRNLLERIAKAAQAGKGYQLSKGYSKSWFNDATRLQEEGKIVFRGGRMFLASTPKPTPQPK